MVEKVKPDPLNLFVNTGVGKQRNVAECYKVLAYGGRFFRV